MEGLLSTGPTLSSFMDVNCMATFTDKSDIAQGILQLFETFTNICQIVPPLNKETLVKVYTSALQCGPFKKSHNCIFNKNCAVNLPIDSKGFLPKQVTLPPVPPTLKY